MKRKKLHALTLCTVLSATAHAQYLTLPSKTFSAGQTICDPTPYKLVFFDDFNGTTLDRTKWVDYTSWAGMPYGDTDEWDGAHLSEHGGHAITKPANVVINNGMCQLILKHEPGTTWRCDTCSTTHTGNYSAAIIATRYTSKNHIDNSYNSGKFEARIKYPTAKKSHGDMWLWPGSQINSIDIAEAYGDPYWPNGYLPWGNNRYCDYSLHSMPPTAPFPPYNYTPKMPNVELMYRYPNQRWIDYVRGRYFDQYNWHTYTCDWDTACVKMYIDNNLINTIYKYYSDYRYPVDPWLYPGVFDSIRVTPANCQIGFPGTYKVLPGFPFFDKSLCNLRFTLDMDEDVAGPNDKNSYYVGETDIDYVKIWQKHPEADNHTDLCNIITPVISGPSYICDQSSFTVSPSSATGTWSVLFPSAVITSSNSTSAVVKNNNSPLEDAQIIYTVNGPAGCPPVSAIKTVDVGAPKTAAVTVFRARTLFFNAFTFSATRPLFSIFLFFSKESSPTLYKWDITYGNVGGSNFHVIAYGKNYTTPVYPINTANSFVDYKLTITNSCGVYVKTGHYTWSNFAKKTQDTTNTFVVGDTSDLYLDALVTDTAAYASAVRQDLLQHFVTDTADTNAINDLIAEARINELEPYIVMPPSQGKGVNNKSTAESLSKTNPTHIVFPNPVTDKLTITNTANINDTTTETITAININGSIIYRQDNVSYVDGKVVIDTKGWNFGVYVICIENSNNSKEYFKVVKAN